MILHAIVFGFCHFSYLTKFLGQRLQVFARRVTGFFMTKNYLPLSLPLSLSLSLLEGTSACSLYHQDCLGPISLPPLGGRCSIIAIPIQGPGVGGEDDYNPSPFFYLFLQSSAGLGNNSLRVSGTLSHCKGQQPPALKKGLGPAPLVGHSPSSADQLGVRERGPPVIPVS